ncbi:hypothetical protein EHS89_19425 [Amphritea balenae]|uniref:Cytochrome c domain-containing protein n=1 Tax=Amphritea balenae TaxID=452629 RepID=A0A3P1SJ54_9GAMM|nr:hypothetical protein EHS89_19425 [Amphritea balenae]
MHTAIASLEYGLTPPELPDYRPAEQIALNTDGWKQDSAWFQHASQGTATLPIPYNWLMALEEPKFSPWLIFWGEEELYTGDYLLRHGFIKQTATSGNPDALPIGLATTPSIYFPGINRKSTAIGFSCAACHTGQLLFQGKRYIIDGGAAMTDLGLLTKSLGAAFGQTVLSSQFPLFNGRFDRFAQRVLGLNDNILTRNQLKQELSATLRYLAKNSDVINVTEGFTRLDALNRIGNQVFDTALNRSANYSAIDAPVNFPHIWTTSWFNWVQYDGSIMQPLIRNAGEALGVEAYVDTTGPDSQRFASSINYHNLIEIEEWLAGKHPRQQQKFNGLRAPQWPASFPTIDHQLKTQGENIYREHCQDCHLPPVSSELFWTDKYWKKIKYIENGEKKTTEQTYLKLNIIPQEKIRTDPAQALILAKRTVDTTGLNLDTNICTPLNEQLNFVTFRDSATSSFALALGAFVQRTNLQWFKQSFTDESQINRLEGSRPNCLQAGQGYKARPLNGAWATAPFLHNGSIATIYDLLSTQEERPEVIQLGNQEFDPERLGIIQPNDKLNCIDVTQDKHSNYDDGLFLLNTCIDGNRNTGHIFDDNPAALGKIGPKLSHEQKMALIEYLKTI